MTGAPGAASAALATVPSATPPVASAAAPEHFTFTDTELRDLDSEATHKRHQLIIGLPPSFRSAPERRYPVLFLLDGQWDFALVATLMGGLRYDQVAPELLIVGLSYAGEHPDYDALRSDDYLPTHAKDLHGVEKGGGAPAFLGFIEGTVMPLVEREYRADPSHRILSGTSYGGLFTLYALFEKPELFSAYVAISPAVNWDQRYIFARERQFRKTHAVFEHRVWLSSGSEEWPGYLAGERAFFKQFQASGYRGLGLLTYEIAGERHAGVKPEAYNRALRYVLKPLLADAAPR